MKVYSFFILILFILTTATLPLSVEQDSSEEMVSLYSQDFDEIEIALYPNPVYEYANIKSNRFLSRIVILNAMGKTATTFEIDEPKKVYKADVSSLPVGLYFIRFYGEENQLLKTYKLLKYDNAS